MLRNIPICRPQACWSYSLQAQVHRLLHFLPVHSTALHQSSQKASLQNCLKNSYCKKTVTSLNVAAFFCFVLINYITTYQHSYQDRLFLVQVRPATFVHIHSHIPLLFQSLTKAPLQILLYHFYLTEFLKFY